MVVAVVIPVISTVDALDAISVMGRLRPVGAMTTRGGVRAGLGSLAGETLSLMTVETATEIVTVDAMTMNLLAIETGTAGSSLVGGSGDGKAIVRVPLIGTVKTKVCLLGGRIWSGIESARGHDGMQSLELYLEVNSILRIVMGSNMDRIMDLHHATLRHGLCLSLPQGGERFLINSYSILLACFLSSKVTQHIVHSTPLHSCEKTTVILR
jgi:hypothetical protein